MESKVIKQALVKLKYTYPNAFKDYSQEDVKVLTQLWCKDFANDNPEVFTQAIEQIRLKNKFCPSIAEVKEEMAKISNPTLNLDVNEEWENVIYAIRKYGRYEEQQALKSLSPYTAKIVRLIGFTRICNSENIDWQRKQFIELFKDYKETYKNDYILDSSLNYASLLENLKLGVDYESQRI